MQQTKRHSLIETVCNTAVGYVINLGIQLVVFPLFGMSLTLTENVGIGAIFTIVSIGRGYILRRLYETYLR